MARTGLHGDGGGRAGADRGGGAGAGSAGAAGAGRAGGGARAGAGGDAVVGGELQCRAAVCDHAARARADGCGAAG
ncbi:hypothetical protein E1261_43045 [Kribbella albertanoniae]|uniref:Uncharacterized protein n=1 Tax=Kribbella albertanoniae TaxID=1266829 RepID=A0A4R4P1F4_9ACTN|nr:hypothetical protein E1261_43045 [Kribbella albertanoniae]